MKSIPEHIQDIVGAGSMIEIHFESGSIILPLAVCEIVQDGKLFYCPPTPYSQHDVHCFYYQTIAQPHELGIMFLGKGNSRAYITTIEEAVTNREDALGYRIAWTKWQRLLASDTEEARRYTNFIKNEIWLAQMSEC